MESLGITLAERGLVPTSMLRWSIRSLLEERLRDEVARPERRAAFLEALPAAPVALAQQAANAQHYEVPSDFYQLVLGRRLKYSCCWWDDDTPDLHTAEERMLALTCERAGLADGQRIFEVGCGWGSLTLYMAEHYPRARIRAISNSHSQRRFIEERCRSRGIGNVEVLTADLAGFDQDARYDRIVSVECLEHMRNHAELFRRFARWLDGPAARLFVHVFCHRAYCYPFETEGADNWLGRHFFTGGMMPSFDLFRRYDDALGMEREWAVDGTHYQRTARAWYERLMAAECEVLELFADAVGPSEAKRIFHRWRLFFLACEETWGYDQGREWLVGHYLLKPQL